jgi:hypothetical protein
VFNLLGNIHIIIYIVHFVISCRLRLPDPSPQSPAPSGELARAQLATLSLAPSPQSLVPKPCVFIEDSLPCRFHLEPPLVKIGAQRPSPPPAQRPRMVVMPRHIRHVYYRNPRGVVKPFLVAALFVRWYAQRAPAATKAMFSATPVPPRPQHSAAKPQPNWPQVTSDE